MGDRGQVVIVDKYSTSNVCLYTHWGASELNEIVARALARKERWSDSEYLARIIFCEMVKGDETGSIGYGIGTQLHSDIWKLIVVDGDNQRVTVNDNAYDLESIDAPNQKYSFDGNFEDFIKMFHKVSDIEENIEA